MGSVGTEEVGIYGIFLVWLCKMWEAWKDSLEVLINAALSRWY